MNHAGSIADPRTGAPPAAPEPITPEEEATRRRYCNWLEYWRDCTAPPCRRMRACAGDPTDCFIRHWAHYSGEAKTWVHAGLLALDRGLGPRAAALAADAALLRDVKAAAKLPRQERASRR